MSAYKGKVTELTYNCFGGPLGFVLVECCMPWVSKTRLQAIGNIAMRVWISGY